MWQQDTDDCSVDRACLQTRFRFFSTELAQQMPRLVNGVGKQGLQVPRIVVVVTQFQFQSQDRPLCGEAKRGQQFLVVPQVFYGLRPRGICRRQESPARIDIVAFVETKKFFTVFFNEVVLDPGISIDRPSLVCFFFINGNDVQVLEEVDRRIGPAQEKVNRHANISRDQTQPKKTGGADQF